ncbi:MAG: nucleotidyltransferase domain-containing protein [Candidatus Parvarchaeota archaeon]|nr:nucleotidyltransferase domain-containing protein [Candidatus Parvarchaeota archaeon]
MNVSIKNVDETAFRKLKAVAAAQGKSMGAVLTEAISAWADKSTEILNGIDDIVKKARRDSEVIAVILFGSYARQEKDFRDIDIALLLKEPIKDSIKKASEYWMSDAFDVSILNSLPLNVASRVLEEGKILYVSNMESLQRFSSNIIRDWSDFKPFYMEQIASD